MANTYIAIIGDFINSKQLKERQSAQEKLVATLSEINSAFLDSLSCKFTITLGDEFQGLLHQGENLLTIIERIETALHPVKIRFAIGIGTISTAIDPTNPLSSDGPAFYHARDAINQLKTKAAKNKVVPTNITLKSAANSNTDELINSLFAYLYQTKTRWTVRQRAVIDCYRQNNEKQKETAIKLGVNQSSVQRALQAAGYYTYKNTVVSLTTYFSQIGVKENV